MESLNDKRMAKKKNPFCHTIKSFLHPKHSVILIDSDWTSKRKWAKLGKEVVNFDMGKKRVFEISGRESIDTPATGEEQASASLSTKVL